MQAACAHLSLLLFLLVVSATHNVHECQSTLRRFHAGPLAPTRRKEKEHGEEGGETEEGMRLA